MFFQKVAITNTYDNHTRIHRTGLFSNAVTVPSVIYFDGFSIRLMPGGTVLNNRPGTRGYGKIMDYLTWQPHEA